jgi:hypothetical protein
MSDPHAQLDALPDRVLREIIAIRLWMDPPDPVLEGIIAAMAMRVRHEREPIETEEEDHAL